jgi:hypothetical protein
VNIKRLRASLAGVVLFVAPQLAGAESQPQMSAADLVKAVIENELHPSNAPEIRWQYRLDKELDGKQETRQVLETKSGSLERLLSIAGKPLTDAQARDEAGRILRFVNSPDEQRKAEQTRRKDTDQCNEFMKMIPDAFIFEYAGESGTLTKVTFKPNPRFRPPSREGKVLQQMAGEIWVDATQQRLASIRGQLMNEVRFGGGFLGHLEKGGQFWVKRAEIAAGDWEMTEMNVNMRGKALLFKSICVQQKELHTNFERVPDNMTLADAANLLLHQNLVAFKQ